MRILIQAAACAAVCFASRSALAQEADGVAKRRLFLPTIVGYSYGTSGLAGAGSMGSVTGLVSYSNGSATQPDGTTASFEGFGLAPNFDVRVGRLTLGAAVSLMRMSTSSTDSSSQTSTTLSAAPRIGVMVPLTSSLSLWPRLSVGGSYGSFEGMGSNGTTSSFLINTDVLMVLGLGSHLFLTLGPNAGWSTTIASGGAFGRESAFHLGVGMGIGVAI